MYVFRTSSQSKDAIDTVQLPRMPKAYHRRFVLSPDDTLSRRLHCVRHDAPVTWRNAVHRFAVYFRREFQYDFIQYSPDESESLDRAFLFTHDRVEMLAVGACSFRYHTNGSCGLSWIWLHPYYRGRGMLSQAWPYFVRRFAPFQVEPPLSKSMTSFMRKLGIADPWNVHAVRR